MPDERDEGSPPKAKSPETKIGATPPAPTVPGQVIPAPTSQPLAGPSAAAQAATPSERPKKETPKDGVNREGAFADAVKEGHGPVGLQKEPATMTPTGSIPGRTVASPSGPVPISVVAGSEEKANEILKQQDPAARPKIAGQYKRLTEEDVSKMSGGELRAVAHDRGYTLPEGGNRTTRRRFLELQDKDESLKKGAGEGGKTASGTPDLRDSQTVFKADAGEKAKKDEK